METARKITRAKLIEIRWNESGSVEEVDGGKVVPVQFNPATLKVSYTNQVQSNDQSTASSIQYVGKGTSKMGLELLFDISMPIESEENRTRAYSDVREITREVTYFITPKPDPDHEDRFLPPGVRFSWGSFLFEGIVESMDETLELWSEDGIPLRATMTMNLGQQGVFFGMNPNATRSPTAGGAGARGGAGTSPLAAARAGDSLQSIAARLGKAADWQGLARANGIENPRILAPGQMINIRTK
jgi:hypothetical protein